MTDGFEHIRARIREQPLRRAAYLAIENRQLRRAIGDPWPDCAFVGCSAAAAQVAQAIRSAAAIDGAVLVTGEPGVGKRLVARLIHTTGARADRPFVRVDCRALSGELTVTELCGIPAGAPRGGKAGRPGRLELAAGGTLLLDEVSHIPADAQDRLLTYLQAGALRQIGGDRDRAAHARIISSSSYSLEARAASGLFKPALLGRLGRIVIHLPPLRERREDIPVIAAHVLERANPTRPPIVLDDDARDALVEYSWPGNVRELDRALQRAIAVGDGLRIRRDDLPLDVREGAVVRIAPWVLPRGARLREIERLALQQTLLACNGNGAEAARRLGLSKKGMYIKLRRFGLPFGKSRQPTKPNE